MMTAGSRLTAVAAAMALLALGACDEGQTSGPSSSGFQKEYSAARSALEAGNYSKANRLYAKMLPSAGPLTPRIQLEYAHSLLREGEYAAAAQQAQAVSANQEGTQRSAALSVYAAALHELGLTAIAAGDTTAAKQNLTAAGTAIAEVLKNDPQLDPLGALAGRKASIAVQLKSLA